jgi:hypothetical protein
MSQEYSETAASVHWPGCPGRTMTVIDGASRPASGPAGWPQRGAPVRQSAPGGREPKFRPGKERDRGGSAEAAAMRFQHGYRLKIELILRRGIKLSEK